MDKVSILITNPDILEIFSKLKRGVTKRFAVERAMEMLYNDPTTRDLLFDDADANKGKLDEDAPIMSSEPIPDNPAYKNKNKVDDKDADTDGIKEASATDVKKFKF